ncbi:MAG: cell division FtsA domain-containing protein [Bacilli bacterium]|nr:cell division FtsA domain-containing protein [Bacilli bacterium]
MEKLTACFEISSDAVKVLIGYELGGAPVVLYRAKKELPGLIKGGQITDPNGLVKALAELHNLSDDAVHLKISISEVCFILPPIGLMVYESDKSTNVVAPNNEIAKIDISNVVSLVKKQPIPGGNSVVDIIPDEFVLDDGSRYADPPLGLKSTSLTIRAKIHALPDAVSSTYNRLMSTSGYRVKKASVSTYCIAELFKTYRDLPASYILVDMGGRLTTVSLIGEGSPYSSASFYSGGDDLTEEIATAFGCTFATAEKLKVEYGYREKIHSYDPPLPLNGEGEEGDGFHQKHLNDIIANHFESYAAVLTNAISSLLSRYGDKLDNLPIVFTGGASKLRGLETFMAKAMPNREQYFVVPRTIGARDPGYSALLGLLLCSGRYVGSLEDNYHGMGSVARVPKEKAKKSRSSDNDAL